MRLACKNGVYETVMHKTVITVMHETVMYDTACIRLIYETVMYKTVMYIKVSDSFHVLI